MKGRFDLFMTLWVSLRNYCSGQLFPHSKNTLSVSMGFVIFNLWYF